MNGRQGQILSILCLMVACTLACGMMHGHELQLMTMHASWSSTCTCMSHHWESTSWQTHVSLQEQLRTCQVSFASAAGRNAPASFSYLEMLCQSACQRLWPATTLAQLQLRLITTGSWRQHTQQHTFSIFAFCRAFASDLPLG